MAVDYHGEFGSASVRSTQELELRSPLREMSWIAACRVPKRWPYVPRQARSTDDAAHSLGISQSSEPTRFELAVRMLGSRLDSRLKQARRLTCEGTRSRVWAAHENLVALSGIAFEG